jgi:hypothetical protein
MRHSDARAIRRILTERSVNGEWQAVSERYRPLADKLASLPGEQRQGCLEAFLHDRADREEIILALAKVDPDDPAPEPEEDEDEDDGWEPIRLGTLPPAEPFPLDVLPVPARDLAEAAAVAIACPVDFPAVASLAAASGIIGQSASLLIKSGHFASASLYVALVGSPSTGKSPALNAALKPAWSIAERLDEDRKAAIKEWKAVDEDDRGEKPERERIITTDPTTEALAPILATNPRGLIFSSDEMTKWVLSMDQYRNGKGGDRPFYLSAWNGQPVYVDRAKNIGEPIVVPHPFVTVVGGMIPDMLSALSEQRGREDGFMARLLFCYPEKIRRVYSGQGLPESVTTEWDRLAENLWSRKLRELDGRPAPHVVKLSPEAESAWAVWCQAHYDEQNADDFPESMEGPWGKLEAYCPRGALILHLMHVAADPVPSKDDSWLVLPRARIEDSIRLMAYFKSHARRVYASMSGKTGAAGDDVRMLIRWILRNGRTQFSIRDIRRNLNRFKNDPGSLWDALHWMTEHNVIRPAEIDPTPRPGRKRTSTFDVNPSLRTPPQN